MKANYGLFIGLVFTGLTPFSVAQVPIAPGVYACDGAAQAGPCNGGNASGGSSSSSYGVVGYVICAELAGDFHLGYARQLTDKSSLLFDLAF